MTLDFTSGLDFFWAMLPEVVLCVWGLFVLLRGVSPDDPGGDEKGSGWLALAGLALAAGANGWLYGVAEAGVGSPVAVDSFRLFANWVILIAAAMGIVASFAYVDKQRLQAPEYYALIIYSAVGMMTMVAARDLILMFIALELMSLAVYVLAGFNRRDRRSAESGLKYFLLGAFASSFFLYGIALVYGATGTTNIVAVAESVQAGTHVPLLLTLGVLMLTVGFAFKVSVVPFHMWTPDVYEGAPTPVTAYMSAAVKAAAFVAFFRVFYVAFEAVHGQWEPAFWWLAVATMVGANVMALAQHNVKRMLAYSSVAHGGYLLVALVALNDAAAAGLLFYLLIYAVMNIGAFAVVIVVSNHAEERQHVEDYSGFGWQQPVLGVALTVFLLSLAGFPGTGGFMGKVFLLLSARDAQLWSLAVILVLTTIASYWYYLRVAWHMWMKDPREGVGHEGVVAPLSMRFMLLAGVVIIMLTGILPGVGLDLAQAGAESLMAGPIAH